MTREEQMLNGFTEMMRGFWNNQDLEIPNHETPRKQEPCDDAVSRRATIEIARSNIHYESNKEYEYARNLLQKTMAEISELPPVTPQPQTGHWKHNKCDVCEASRPPLFDNFCPNCGAKMVERQESEEV